MRDPRQGLNPHPLWWKLRVLTPGPPGIKKSQYIMSNAISEIKNTLEATNSRITEAEDRISELEDRMADTGL